MSEHLGALIHQSPLRDLPGPSVSAEPEVWIVGIATRSDKTCFISLFSTFAPKVKGYLMRRGASEALAEEIAQDTFLAVWRKAGQFDPLRASASAWIYTIARNLYVDSVRRDRRPDDHQMPECGDAPVTPEEQLKTVEGESRVRHAIAALPSEQAKALQLAFFEEKTHVEIATLLGLPLGTVKSRIRLAAAHLRSVLEDLA